MANSDNFRKRPLMPFSDVLEAINTDQSESTDCTSEEDDNVADPDFITEPDAMLADLHETAEVNDAGVTNADDVEQPPATANATAPPIKRHKHAKVQKWKQNITKNKRLKGESYKKKNGQQREKRKLGPPCTSEFCQKSSLRMCESINEEQRKSIFDKFWSMETWKERHLYIQTLVDKNGVKQKKVDHDHSRRNSSLQYRLKLPDGSAVPVCKKFFASTFGISERTVASWLEDPTNSKKAPVAESDQDFLNQWLAGLPTVPSHYCRNTPTYQNKKFLEPGTTIANLHREYKKAADENEHRVLSIKLFSEAFHNLIYSVFVPRKDQCDTCLSMKHGNVNNETYLAHIQAKNEARAEKGKDKTSAGPKKSVWTLDVQAVLTGPKTRASALYYKTKLQVHNLSFYNLLTHEGFCYVWDESEGDVNAEMFAHLQYKHFSEMLDSHPEIEEIIVWSDGCSYQNRNVTLANGYIDLAKKYGVKITQKYLVVGHTQMEVDSMHAVIEKRIVGNIYTPRDYIVIMETARTKPAPYVVKPVYHYEVLKLDGAYNKSIRPGKKPGDPTVYDLRALEFQPTGQVQFKLSFSEDSSWKILPQRMNIPKKPFAWIRHFESQLPIKSRKFNDLQSMKSVLPKWAHGFYDALPHDSE